MHTKSSFMFGVGVLALAAVTLGVSAQKDHLSIIRTGFLTGNSYRELSYDEKLTYVMGVHDAFVNGSLMGAPDSSTQAMVDCIPKLTQIQLEAIVSKYLAENPEKWGFPMSVLVYSALPKTCKP